VLLVFGPGAHWLSESQERISLFMDLSRENQQLQYRNGLLNYGMSWNRDALEKYKIAFFVEWPVLEAYRTKIVSKVDYYVDMNEPKRPVFTGFAELECMIHNIAEAPLRVKPFFAPGVWGGQYLKEIAGLPEDWVNCAWSFEPIAPENSILIEHQGEVIELPFLLVMAFAHQAIMGERLVSLFGSYFPIRLDYLDTMGGTNLSCQVHPKQAYIREHFNELLEQQESYYIMEKQGDAKVYLGLTESCTRDSLLDAVQTAQETLVPMEFAAYVKEWEARKGDLFLIPTGTVHCSGKDNLVLEISATTWWFTFKIYDYLRLDLDGKPRPINIDYAFDNIDFHKNADWVQKNLIPEPLLLERQGKNEEYQLGKRPDLLFYVNRIHLESEWRDDTRRELMLLNLVEGEQVRVVSNEDASVFVELSYAESYILPSVFGEFTILNLGARPCKLIKAGVSSEWDVNLV
jgi:mannose-6-phosphate isomerase class I